MAEHTVIGCSTVEEIKVDIKICACTCADVPGFACEDDSSDDSDSSSVDWDEYRGILDDCDDDDSDDDATASKEPAQASTYKKAALKGQAAHALPKEGNCDELNSMQGEHIGMQID